MSRDDDVPVPTSFSSVPKSLIDAVRDVVEPQGITILRPVYEEAIIELCNDLDGGLVINPWPMPRPGLARHKVTVRMSLDVSERMKATVTSHDTRKGVFFRVALIRWLAKRGIHIDF